MSRVLSYFYRSVDLFVYLYSHTIVIDTPTKQLDHEVGANFSRVKTLFLEIFQYYRNFRCSLGSPTNTVWRIFNVKGEGGGGVHPNSPKTNSTKKRLF